jgi:hypothetical protein
MPRGGWRWYGGVRYPGAWEPRQRRFIIRYAGKTHKVHRLICEAFNGPPPFPGAMVVHVDKDARNNRAENLKWGDGSQRTWAARRRRCGRYRRGRLVRAKRHSRSRGCVILRWVAQEHNGSGNAILRALAGSPMPLIADTERTQIYRQKRTGHKPLELLSYLAGTGFMPSEMVGDRDRSAGTRRSRPSNRIHESRARRNRIW